MRSPRAGHVGHDDGVTTTAPARERYPDFAALLAAGEDEEMSKRLRSAETIGRPLGDEAFLARLEQDGGRALRPVKRGRPRKSAGAPLP